MTRDKPNEQVINIDTLRTRYGLFHVPGGDDLISNSLKEYGEWAQAELNVLRDFIAEGDSVIDGGACFGTHARAFSDKVGPKGRVICFEPSVENREILAKNVSVAPVKNIDVRPSALGAAKGWAKEAAKPAKNAGATSISADNTGSISMVRLDDDIQGSVDFIKLDLEGFELSALEGAHAILSKDRPVVFCEALGVSGGAVLRSFMQKHNYMCLGLNTPAFQADNFNRSRKDIFFGGTECGLLFLPLEELDTFQSRIEIHRLPAIENLDDMAALFIGQPQYILPKLDPVIAARRIQMQGSQVAQGEKQSRNLNDKLVVLENELAETKRVTTQSDDKLRALEKSLAASEKTRVRQSERLIQVSDKLREATAIADALAASLNVWQDNIEYAKRLAKRACKFPFALYFRIKASHRRPIRKLLQPIAPESTPQSHLASLRHLLDTIAPANESASSADTTAGHRQRARNAITSVVSIPVLAPFPAQIETPLDAQSLNSVLSECRDLIVVSISHDDYRKVTGGTQNCIQIEQKAAAKADMDYLNIHPVRACNALLPKAETDTATFRIALNGETIGVARYDEILAAIAMQSTAKQTLRFVVHHLLGHSPEAIAKLLEAGDQGRAYFWLHDYFGACQSYILLRNNMSYCGAPDAASQSCMICRYGLQRKSHIERFRAFFEESEITALAPSQAAADIWTRSCDYELKELIVRPHIELVETTRLQNLSKIEDVHASAIRVAYSGVPVEHKGWGTFARLVAACEHNSELEFHYFGSSDVELDVVKHHVDVVASQVPDAMIRAISSNGIDLVVHFAVWPETFSLTAAEALASSAFIVTNSKSGNVADLVRKTGRGVVLDDEESLIAWMASDDCHALVQQAREKRRTTILRPEFSDMAITQLRS
ncbi:MAG: FkbM family methyltransferase [Pseudomonadota bacterium]